MLLGSAVQATSSAHDCGQASCLLARRPAASLFGFAEFSPKGADTGADGGRVLDAGAGAFTRAGGGELKACRSAGVGGAEGAGESGALVCVLDGGDGADAEIAVEEADPVLEAVAGLGGGPGTVAGGPGVGTVDSGAFEGGAGTTAEGGGTAPVVAGAFADGPCVFPDAGGGAAVTGGGPGTFAGAGGATVADV